MNDSVKLSTEGTIGIVIIDNPPVNVLSSDVCDQIGRCLDTVVSNPAIEAAVLIGAGRSFVAGEEGRTFSTQS
jgi:3-hydroxyacyl-CoA dehydrogenase